MLPSKRGLVLLVLGQPGAEAFFRPVIADIRELGWEVAVNQEAETVSPTVVITSATYAAEERKAVEWARVHGVCCAQLVDSWYDYRRRIALTNGPDLLPDEIWLFDETARVAAISEGLPADRLRITGNPVWETVQALPVAPKSRILLVDQTVGSDMGCRLGYEEQDFFELVRDGLRTVYSDQLKIFIAPHPRRMSQELDIDFAMEIVKDSREALQQCGTVIGMFSSLLIDAFLGGRSVVTVQPGATTDFCVLSQLDLVPRVTAANQLPAAIDSAEPGPQGFGTRFLGSSSRVCDTLSALVSRGQR